MQTFNEQIADIKQNQPQIYKTLTLDLSSARSEYEMPISGNYFLIMDASDINTNIDVRFNMITADRINLIKGRGVKLPFYKIYLSNTAQSGKSITIVYGISDTPLEYIDKATLGSIQNIADPVSVLTPLQVYRKIDNITTGQWSLPSPPANTIFFDTGDLPAGNYMFNLVVYAPAQVTIDMWITPADNSADFLLGRDYIEPSIERHVKMWGMVTLLQNQQVRGITGNPMTGLLKGFFSIWRYVET